MGKKIIDEYSDRKLSRQRKWQLRHPEQQKAISKRWVEERGGREKNRLRNIAWRERQKQKEMNDDI